MPATIGSIGCGNMGTAILSGFAARLDKKSWRLVGYDRNPQKLDALEKHGVEAMHSVSEIAREADILLLAVKPHQIEAVLREAGQCLKNGCVVVSIAAGFSMAALAGALGRQCSLIRCMPTTTALAGRGIFALHFDDATCSKQVQQDITQLFRLLGYCVELPESRFTDFSALIGAGPAYVFAMMQGLAQAGITLGFSREQSRKMLVELFAGCAELAAMQSKPLMQLRDDVCSPGGLTIAGVNVLDRAGLSGLLVDAVLAAARRGREMEA